MATVNDLKIRIQAALEGKTTFKETSSLLKDISDKLKETKQSSSNFNLLAKEYEKMNKILQTQKQAVDEVINKEKNLDKARRDSAKAQQQAGKLEEQENKKRLKEIQDKENAEKKLADQKQKTLEREQKQALIKQQKFDAGFTGQNVTLGSTQAITQMKQYLATLNPLDPAFAKVNARLREYQTAQDKARNSSKLLTQQNVSFLAGLSAIGIGISQVSQRMKTDIVEGFKGESLLQNFTGTADELKKIQQSAAGLVEDNKLTAVTNWASSLNNSIEQQAKLWQASRIISQKTGQDIEGIFRSMIKSEEGMTKGLIQSGVSRTRYNEVIKESVKSLGGETEEIKDGNGEKEIQIKNLSSEMQTRLRQDALLKVLTEKYGDLNNVQTTNYEKTQMLTVAIKDSREEIGLYIGTGLLKLSEVLVGTGDDAVKTAGKIGAVGGVLKDMLPILAGLKFAFPAAFSAVLPVLGAVGLQIGGLILLVKSFIDSLPAIQNAWTFLQDIKSGKDIGDSFTEGVNRFEQKNGKTSKELGITEGNEYVEGVVKGIQEKKRLAEEKIKMEALLPKQEDKPKKSPKGLGSHSMTPKETEKALNTEQQILKDIAELESKLAIETLPLQTKEFKKQIVLQQEKLKYLRGEYENTDFSGFAPKNIQDTPIANRTGGQVDLPRVKESISLLKAELIGLGTLEGVMNGLSSSVGGLFAAFVPPQGAETPLKTFLKNVVLSMITATQAAILTAQGFAAASSIFSFGLSLLKDAPLIALALVALEGAKGIVGALAKGTNDWVGGTALVGEQGPELVNLPRHAQVFPHKETMNILNANIANQTPQIKNEQYFRLDMNKGQFYEESRDEFERYKRAIR